MSIVASNWAWSMGLGGTAGNVLGALAHFADDTGCCFPSVRTLADMCNVDERTVQRINRKFVAEEYMFVERRFRPNGSPTSNGYRLNLSKQPPPPRCRRGRGENDTGVVTCLPGGRWQPCHQGGDHGAGVTTTEPSIDTSPQQLHPTQESRTEAASASNGSRSGLCFSKNVSMTLQDSLIRLFVGLRLEHAQQVLDELTGQMKATHVRDPVRYCARLVERFKRGEFQLDRGWAVARDRQARGMTTRTPHEAPTTISAPAGPVHSRMPDSFRDVMERIRNGPSPRQDDVNAGIGDSRSDDAENDPD